MEQISRMTFSRENSSEKQVTGGVPVSREVQTIEVAVFLLLIVPPLATSFLISHQADIGFTTSAVLSILNDLGLVSLVLYFIWRNHEPLQRIGWTLQKLPWEVAWGLLLFLPVMIGANSMESALHSLGLAEPSKLPAFLVATGSARIVLAVFLVIVVAVVEETVFRGYLLLRLETVTHRPWAAVLLSAFVFSIGHGYEGPAGAISIFFLGIVLAVIYLWRKSLVAPMVIHFCIDFSSIVLAALIKTNT